MGICCCHLGKYGKGRIKVGHYFPVDGDKASLACQGLKCLEIWFMHENPNLIWEKYLKTPM